MGRGPAESKERREGEHTSTQTNQRHALNSVSLAFAPLRWRCSGVALRCVRRLCSAVLLTFRHWHEESICVCPCSLDAVGCRAAAGSRILAHCAVEQITVHDRWGSGEAGGAGGRVTVVGPGCAVRRVFLRLSSLLAVPAAVCGSLRGACVAARLCASERNRRPSARPVLTKRTPAGIG